MNRFQHHTNNDVLGAPKGVPIEECNALPITRGVHFGVECVASFWLPDAAELAALNAGKPVFLVVQGVTHAPVIVGVEA